MIKQCKCEHSGQDKLHGKNKRVMNPHTKNGKTAYRCTVCNSTKD